MRLILLRHGQTTSNLSGALDTASPGASLSDLGRAQANAAAQALHDRGIDGLFVSNLLRTHETIAPLAEVLGITPTELDGFREIQAGDHEMKSDHDAVHGYLTAVSSWIEGDHEHRMAGGESGVEFLGRYDDAVARIVESDVEHALVVSHGAAIRTWVANRASGGEHWVEHAFTPLHNTGAIELEQNGDGWRIIRWDNDPIGGDYLEDDAPDPTAG